jgi:hypothetical protein
MRFQILFTRIPYQSELRFRAVLGSGAEEVYLDLR